MKRLLAGFLLLIATVSSAQLRVYPVGDMVAVGNTATTTLYAAGQIAVTFSAQSGTVGIVRGGELLYRLNPADFLNQSGSAYGATLSAASVAWQSVLASARPRSVNYSEAERIRIEGLDIESTGLTYPTGFPATTTTTIASSATMAFGTFSAPVSLGGFGPPITKKWYIDHYTLGTTMPVFARVSLGRANTGDVQLFSGSGSYRAGAVIYGGDGSIGVNLYGKTDTTRRAALKFGFHGYTASADSDTDAPYYVNIYGDSNTEGTSVQGVASRWDVWSWQLKAWYQNVRKQKVHLVDKSLAGQSSVYFDKIRLGGRLEGIRTPSLGLWVLGTNDSDTALYRTNLTRFITDWSTQYPASPLIICGPGPRSAGSAGETTASYIRAINAQVVAQVNRPGYVYTVSFGTAFPNNVETYFTTTDGTSAGNRVHWNALGQTLIFATLRDFITTNSIELYLPPN